MISRLWMSCIACALTFSGPLIAADLQILKVQHDRNHFDPAAGQFLSIRYQVTEPSSVALTLFDARDFSIRRIQQDAVPAGEGSLFRWDGKDQAGNSVPPGAYHYTRTAVSTNGTSVEYDLTDLTGREPVDVRDIHWDPDAGTIRYVVPSQARVNVRIGLANGGPLLRTLINWVPRSGGMQTEQWDGMDQSGVLDLSRHPNLDIAIEAFSLSDNTVLVGKPQDRDLLIEDISWDARPREVKKHLAKRMYAHAQQDLKGRQDFAITLSIPSGLATNEDGVPVVSGILPVRLEIAEDDRIRAQDRRFEPVFFLDGIFVFENETGFLPMTWNWDTRRVNPGIHYLSANLRGYEGNFGMVTVKVQVAGEATQ